MCPHPTLSWSQTLSTSCLVAVPVFVELCCIFFQTCLQVLLRHVTFAGFYKTKSAFIKRNIKNSSSHHDTYLSTHVLPLGLWLGFISFCWCCCLFVILKGNCTFKESLVNLIYLFFYFFLTCTAREIEPVRKKKKKDFCFNSKKHLQLSSLHLSLPVFP